MTQTYPKTVREALAFLARRPMVRFTTRLDTRSLRSNWRYRGITGGVIWFDHARGEGTTGLPLRGTSQEVGLTFDEAGFHYQRGTTLVRVAYQPESEGS